MQKVKESLNGNKQHLLKEIDYIGREILSENGVNGINQTIFVLFGLGINSENRSVALRAVSTDDFMTVTPFEISWKVLEEIRERISGINGVGSFVIDVTDKPPTTTCWK